MVKKIIPILLLLLLMTGCIRQHACIGWTDFIKFNNILYEKNNYTDNISEELIDKEIGEVKFNVSQNIDYINYKLKNGDAAFHKKGVKLYKLKDYNTSFRIAAKYEKNKYTDDIPDELVDDGNIYLIYEATNPKAKMGKDLLDIQNKVIYLGINSETDGKTEIASIKDTDKIKKMVNMILDAKVDLNNKDYGEERYFISFHLEDGTNSVRCFSIDSGKLGGGIMLPEEFGIEIRNAILER